MTHSESVKALTAALLRFQLELGPIATNAEGERTRYADLDQLREATRQQLTACGLVVVQSGGYDTIETTLLHRSGEWLTVTATCARSVSGEVGYGARHAYMLALGLTELPPTPVERQERDHELTMIEELEHMTPEEVVKRNAQRVPMRRPRV